MNKKQLKEKISELIEFAKRQNNRKQLYPTLVLYDKSGKVTVHEIKSEEPIMAMHDLSNVVGIECAIVVMGAYVREIDGVTEKSIKYDALSLHGELKSGTVINVVMKDFENGTYGEPTWTEDKREDVIGKMRFLLGESEGK